MQPCRADPGVCYIAGAMPLTGALCPRPQPGDLVIAADGGYAWLTGLGVTPDVTVGDFDSLGHVPAGEQVVRLPAVKDDTDMVYAIRMGLARGYRRFVLLGGMGGRVEHTLANLQCLDWLTTQGAVGVLAGDGTVATALRDGSLRFPAGLGGFLSVFCNSGTAEGVTLRHLKYELTRYSMTGSFPIGVSNEFLEEPALVTVERGSLLLLWREQGDLSALLPALWQRN